MRTAEYVELAARRATIRAVSGRRIAEQIQSVSEQLEDAGAGIGLSAEDIARRTGPGWAHFDSTLGEALAAMTVDVAKQTAGALREEWLPMVREAVDKWPIETGKSLEGLSLSFDASTGVLRSRLTSDASYTHYIRYPGGGKRMVWNESVAKPAKLVARRIIDRIMGRRS